MSPLLRYAIIRLVLLLLLGLLVGRELGSLLLGVIIALSIYALDVLFNYWHFQRWLDAGMNDDKPLFNSFLKEMGGRISRIITQQKQQAKQLQAEVDFFRDAFSALQNAIIIIDQRGLIVWANRAAKSIMGIDLARDEGQRLLNLYRSPSFDHYLAAANFKQPALLASPYDQNKKLEIEVSPILDKQLLFVRDVSAAVKLDNIRQDFIGNVSHELRTPLTVISGYLHLLKDHQQDLPIQWSNVIENMQQQSTRMDDLVNDLILLSRLETFPLDTEQQTVLIKDLLQSLIDDAQVMAPQKQITLVIEDSQLKEKTFAIEGTEKELRSAFSNLIRNAIAYTEEKGEIEIRCYCYYKTFRVSVSDNGEGIEQSHLARLTERFYRVDESRTTATGGTGLGLSIVKHVMQRHQGTLEIASTVGKGSKFSCVFPMSRLKLTPL